MKADVHVYGDDYYGCCKAVIIHGFGNGHKGEKDSDTVEEYKDVGRLEKYTKADYLKDMIDAIHIQISYCNMSRLFVAITTSTQSTAAKALKAVGFSKNGRPVMVTEGHYLQHWSLDKNRYTAPHPMPKPKNNIRRYW